MVRLSGAQSVAASALVAFCAESSRSASERTVALPSSAGSARWCACPGEAAHAPSPDAISRDERLPSRGCSANHPKAAQRHAAKQSMNRSIA